MDIRERWIRIQRAQTRARAEYEEKVKSLGQRLANLQKQCPHPRKNYCMGGVPEDSGYECLDCGKWLG